jgi:hypothetical protein
MRVGQLGTVIMSVDTSSERELSADRALLNTCHAAVRLHSAGAAHLPYNPSATEEVVAVIVRTDPNEKENVSLLPELDGLHA